MPLTPTSSPEGPAFLLGLERPPDLVLLDMGGVLTPDPWQTLMLTPREGIADRLGIDHERVARAADQLWPAFSLRRRIESDWWDEVGQLLDVRIPKDLVRQVERRLLKPLVGAVQLIEEAQLIGDVGLISDNTAFWYAKQSSLLQLASRTRPSLRFLSFTTGLAKRSRPSGLFELAAERLQGRDVLVLDDQVANCDRARAVGFDAVLVSLNQVPIDA